MPGHHDRAGQPVPDGDRYLRTAHGIEAHISRLFGLNAFDGTSEAMCSCTGFALYCPACGERRPGRPARDPPFEENKMIQLRFPLRDVLVVAEHAIAAPDHKPSFADKVDGRTPAPALWFVGDDGLYRL